MKTQCTGERLEFHALGRRMVTGRFDGGRISSDAGGVLLREVDKRTGVTARMSRCFVDYRHEASVEHSVHELVSQRVYGIALGYEDLNDHGELRCDAVLSMLVGKSDVTGEKRIRERDRGYALASASTLNRMELGEPQEAAHERYKRMAARPEAFDELLVELFVESHSRAPREVWLDLDATDDPLHGEQEGRFFHGYYGGYCYLPLYIFCGEHLLCARLRESNRDASAGCLEELDRIVRQLRRHWPRTRIHIRGDSGFCREALMRWCEEHGVGFVPGLARNRRLVHALGAALHEARRAHHRTGRPARRFRDFTYRTRKSWSRKRRVVGKAEYLSKGENPRCGYGCRSHRPVRMPTPLLRCWRTCKENLCGIRPDSLRVRTCARIGDRRGAEALARLGCPINVLLHLKSTTYRPSPPQNPGQPRQSLPSPPVYRRDQHQSQQTCLEFGNR